eukprot:5545737-Pleurochrysis_carterae.AAC.2
MLGRSQICQCGWVQLVSAEWTPRSLSQLGLRSPMMIESTQQCRLAPRGVHLRQWEVSTHFLVTSSISARSADPHRSRVRRSAHPRQKA